MNADRTNFNIVEKSGGAAMDIGMGPDWETIVSSSFFQVNDFLGSYIIPLREANLERIRRYIEDKSPRYRPLIAYKKEEVGQIAPNLTDDKLESELHRLYANYEGNLRGRFNDLLTRTTTDELDSIQSQVNDFMDEWTEDGKAKLAEHVAFRSATLKLLDKIIQRNDQGRYALEQTVHNMIFPMRVTSDTVLVENSNLWIIDERLSYHQYLASDIPFSKMQDRLVVAGEERPDLLIFQTASALVEGEHNVGSVVIVEFKRPERTDYTPDENPISQVYNYVDKIRSGQVRDRKGRTVNVPQGIPFFAYIVADNTPHLGLYARQASLTPTYDNRGYFGFNSVYNCYVEVIGFDKLLIDAQRRNAILFDKLGIR